MLPGGDAATKKGRLTSSGGQQGGRYEGGNGAPGLAILRYAIRDIIGTFGGGWRRLHGRAGQTNSLMGEEMSERKAG